ncbi:uncharacterized protein LOC131146104 isoform X4 [Malania oleifera]|uniref:uncharacterized protein LOC131146104 isoform X4 n=1 Tax=Malania oleifera TaxID=397392 RepID=UPI0025AE291D|nr:uncharacterized protein LOC131146104 isoform X4 [Malania oleifera]
MGARSPPPSPPSASNSQNSATHPISQASPKPQVDGATNNGVPDVLDKKPDLAYPFQELDNADHVEKYNKYEADYVRRLQAKYFSRKNLYGGNIFDEKATIDGETIKSSRWPCTRSYADPVWGFEDLNSSSSTSTAIVEALTSVPNGKHVLNKSC